MIIKRKKTETMEVEQYLKNDVVVFYNDDFYKKETYDKVVKITPLLPKGKWFLFDSTRVYRINSNEEMFDINEGENDEGYEYEITECENVALFLDEYVGCDEFIDFIARNLDEHKNTPLKQLRLKMDFTLRLCQSRFLV